MPTTGSYVAAALVLLAVAAAVFTYRSARGRGAAMRHRLVLTTLRIATLALVLFCLFRPVLVVRAAVPQQNFVGVLIDDSRSMQIADEAGRRAGAIAREQFAPESPLMKSSRGQVRRPHASASRRRAPPGDRGADVRRLADPPGRGARARPPGAAGLPLAVWSW